MRSSGAFFRLKKLMSCVQPGVLLVRASLLFRVSVFIADDLPAFDLPANATSAPSSGGH